MNLLIIARCKSNFQFQLLDNTKNEQFRVPNYIKLLRVLHIVHKIRHSYIFTNLLVILTFHLARNISFQAEMPISKSAQVGIRTWYNFESAHALRLRWIIVWTYVSAHANARTQTAWISRDILPRESERERACAQSRKRLALRLLRVGKEDN